MTPADKDILSKLDHKDGLTVPEGYFADFAERMTASLPPRPELEQPTIIRPQTLWQRVRPYAYMVAMFAGVWCMLKMFSTMSSTPEKNAIDTNPVLAQAASNEQFIDEYFIDDVNQYDLYESLMNDGVAIDSIDADSMMMLAVDQNTQSKLPND
jgi:hypothetical protein